MLNLALPKFTNSGDSGHRIPHGPRSDAPHISGGSVRQMMITVLRTMYKDRQWKITSWWVYHVYIYIYIYTYFYFYFYIFTCRYTNIYIYIYIYNFMYTYIYTYIHLHYTHVYIYMYIFTCRYLYIYIYCTIHTAYHYSTYFDIMVVNNRFRPSSACLCTN